MVAIVVQPPTQIAANTQFYPPVVAGARMADTAREHTDLSYVFATAVLLDPTGNVLEGLLGGALVVTGASLPDAQGRGGGGGSSALGNSASLYFVFPDLHISWAGSYSIRVDVYVVDYDDPQGAKLLEQAETRPIAVYDEDVAVERPSPGERAILRRLRDYGCGLPDSPV